MKISYKWLSEYLPETVDPRRLSQILTSIGLEVESMEKYEEAPGGLKGLIIGEVLTTEKHPNADKLTLAKVSIGNGEPLQIVCGAPNVAAGQKVVVAPVGTTIYPKAGDPLTMKIAKIRNVESYGMICAEDEIGLGNSHDGILVLSNDAKVGSTAIEYFKPYEDWIYEIGLTPNHMDAMSHWGVARDVCAYLSHHDRKHVKPKLPDDAGFKADNNSLVIHVKIENVEACPRYSGISFTNLTIKESPKWLRQKLKAIGLRPINNIVDITNFIQHETGQPLHAFDADAIAGKTIIVKNLPEGTPFITLDEKQRKLSSEDLIICNKNEGMCIAGVFGGLHSGVTENTKRIFLESACFDPLITRKTSFRHGLRTDAASRFEKGTDISGTVVALKRAAMLIKEICGGEIASEIVDVYPNPKQKMQVGMKYHYLKKLSGKNYHQDTVNDILISLGFEIVKHEIDEIRVAVPFHKTDITLAADLVEEILRIDGLDNVDIPDAITITPAVEDNYAPEAYKEKTANYLVGLGFYEIMTNSITNSAYFSDDELRYAVKMLNNLSTELDILRPSMLETGLEAIAHNLNRKSSDLKLFEFGKTYATTGPGKYNEPEHLCLYVTGKNLEDGWKTKSSTSDFFVLKGIVSQVLQQLGVNIDRFERLDDAGFEDGLQAKEEETVVIQAGIVNKKILARFDIKQPVYFADLNWEILSAQAAANKPGFKLIPKFPAVQRDLSLVVSRQLAYQEIENNVQALKLNKLQRIRLFDVFESEKLGAGKKSVAINFTFLDEEKTLTDQEIDGWMKSIMSRLEKYLHAEIRK